MTLPGALQPEHVVAVYEQILGRTPSESDIAHHVATLTSLAQMIRVALDSEEYAVAQGRPPGTGTGAPAARPPARVNIHHPDLSQWAHPPGTRDEEGIAVVGHDGWLFLRGGTNLNLPQFLGEVQMEPGWLEGWRAALALRREEVAALGAEMVVLVVPDKLAVYERFFPDPLVRQGPRPIQLLLEAGLPVTYPLEELQTAAEAQPVYLRTDTHLSLEGNALVFGSIENVLGHAGSRGIPASGLVRYVAAGDLGRRFSPEIIEVMSTVGSLLGARMVEDNRAQMSAVGGHIGTRRVFVNDTAPDPRTVVIFGDSFAFGDGAYQGLSWFVAQRFREVHFVWVPFGWDPDYARSTGANLVVFQGAERFLGRVPKPAVDVAGLAEETLRRKEGLDLGAAFGS